MSDAPMVDPRVRALLVCPKCRGELTDGPGVLECPACAVAYPVVAGIPWMLPERARRIRVDPFRRGR